MQRATAMRSASMRSAIARVASFKEINLELACTEANSFVLDSPSSLPTLFAPEENPAATKAKIQEQHRLAGMLATLCATLGEMPHIRHANRPIAASVALRQIGALPADRLLLLVLMIEAAPPPAMQLMVLVQLFEQAAERPLGTLLAFLYPASLVTLTLWIAGILQVVPWIA